MLAIRQAGDEHVDLYPTNTWWSPRCCRRCRRPHATVLLIDELDRSDHEFQAFLLEFLSDFPISIPEIGTIRATSRRS